MDMRGVLIVAIVLCTLSLYPYEVKAQSMELSREEELEIENQLERLNKSSIKIIKTQSGDIYDCVNFYEQPAFDHPLLKNHKYDFQMRPSSRPKGAMNENKPTNKERHQSIVHTKPDPKKKYNGSGTTASFFTLDNVSGSQYSKGQMKIQNGNDFIQVGWTAGEVSCFNTLCPGFVIVSTEIPLDQVLPESHPGGNSSQVVNFFVYKDQVTGNWWLELGNKYNEIGYWPSKIFSDGGLKDLATYVEWGGETYSPPGLLGPPMGSGWLLKGNTADDAYCKFLTTINEAHKTEEDATNTLKYSVDVDFYEVEDWGFRSELRHIMTYGGPGPK
ncbi:protein neprosin-like [Cannabis sativa]|uniref:protein neprosin-like n=1 Tax=Cannabis sativa TaxID=3483 RepID=UPI0029CA2808|nr:protein neprosin-like [Cannabis sativa]